MLRLVLLDTVDRADIGMIERGRRPGLALETLQQVLVARERRREKL